MEYYSAIKMKGLTADTSWTWRKWVTRARYTLCDSTHRKHPEKTHLQRKHRWQIFRLAIVNGTALTWIYIKHLGKLTKPHDELNQESHTVPLPVFVQKP